MLIIGGFVAVGFRGFYCAAFNCT